MSVSYLFAIISSLFVAGWASYSFGMASRRIGASYSWVISTYGMWIVGVAVLALSGHISKFNGTLPPVMGVLVVGVFLAIVFAVSPLGGRIVSEFSLVGLVGFHSFRFLPEILLWLGYREGVFPIQMTLEGRNWDILSAVGAVVVCQLVKKGISSKALGLVWSLFSIPLLLNIVGIAILSVPTSFQVFNNEPGNTAIGSFPYVWLPTIHVTTAIVGHILIIRKLRAN